jgi:hypothetical protein
MEEKMTYRDDFREVERESYWTVKRVAVWLFVGILMLLCIGLVFKVVAFPIWFASRTVDVIQQQIDPAELLRKYELFKDEAAQLDAKQASIKIKQHQIKDMKGLVMDRTNREQLMIWQQELGGMEYSYNALAADYNAQMVKINYRFCNIGQLPQGATVPLPREYKPYMEE